ncbi:MAG: hypothetical protein ACLGIO_13955 [Acidimicrobiia bacterium]
MSGGEERPEGAAGEVLRRGRRAAVRYEVHRGDGCRWELGWDPAMETYFAQRFGDPDADVVSDEMTVWAGTRPGEHPSVDSLEAELCWDVVEWVRAELEADRAAWPTRASVGLGDRGDAAAWAAATEALARAAEVDREMRSRPLPRSRHRCRRHG